MLLVLLSKAQETVHQQLEQQLENLAEADEEATEDDNYLQQLLRYRKKPLDINAASKSDLSVFRWLTDLQIENFLLYRKLLGPLVSVYELQAVPSWDVETIRRTMPFIITGSGKSIRETFSERLRGGDQTLLLRVAQVMEKSKGYESRDAMPAAYPGSRQRVFMRYTYQFSNNFQFGLLGEKDPGEQFFRGAQKAGFDHYGFHLFARNLGKLRFLALGDFAVNLGQGLLSYQSMAFRKSADVMGLKRQADIFRPYHSAGEFNYHRGAAASVKLGHLDVSFFISRLRRSANLMEDTLHEEQIVSSVNESGLHRTAAEIADRRALKELGLGGAIRYRGDRWNAGVNFVNYAFDKPLIRRYEPYNVFQFSGRHLQAISMDASYTWRNMHLFGECAANPGGGTAWLAGLVSSIDRRVDLSILARNFQKNFHSLYANPFAESSGANNEKGVYAGVAVRPHGSWRLDGYIDFYTFPWLRYRMSRPGWGNDYFLQLTWKPDKQWEVYTRLHYEEKPQDYALPDLAAKQTENIPRRNWRTQVSGKVSPALTIRCRAEAMWWDMAGPEAENGFMLFSDMLYKPSLMSQWQIGGRLCFFETDGYNSRIYTYENDVLYYFSIPALFGKGYRLYINGQLDISEQLTFYARVGRTQMQDQESIGSGLDAIPKNHRTELRLQLIWRW